MSTLVLQIPDQLFNALGNEAKSNGLTNDALAERALRYFLFESRFSKIHESLVEEAKQKGIVSDDDVFQRIQ